MTIKVGASGGSTWPFPAIPAPVPNDGALSDQSEVIPHGGTLVNQIKLPRNFSTAGAGGYEGRLDTSVIWTVDPTDINAAADGFMGVMSNWYDSVNDRLYVFALDTGTTPDTIYTSYITLETGGITPVGNFALGTQPTAVVAMGNCATSRAAIDSGNFTLRFADRTVVINESTGAEVTNVASVNVTGSNTPGSYTTLDGTITFAQTQYFSTPDSYLVINRNGISTRVSIAFDKVLWGNSNTSQIWPVNWGDKLKFYRNNLSTNVLMIRTFNRSDFDAWLSDLCDYAGLE